MIFNFARFAAIVRKEFIQMRRDRLTFGMMFGIPIIQLVLFGFAINTDPKKLPTVVLTADNSPFIRSFINSMEVSGYFSINRNITSEEEARKMLARGEAQFIVNFPHRLLPPARARRASPRSSSTSTPRTLPR